MEELQGIHAAVAPARQGTHRQIDPSGLLQAQQGFIGILCLQHLGTPQVTKGLHRDHPLEAVLFDYQHPQPVYFHVPPLAAQPRPTCLSRAALFCVL
jgi:hypothetical protein